MKNQYQLSSTIDLSLDDVEMSENEEYLNIKDDLLPTEAMQLRFLLNCVEMGILVEN